ncbi:hypothetical protein [Paraburkholderia sp.]|uniref:hypothetical protein n=1 Tax=Paraburkholderia sp. TaxID=1926495 RepID=UPI0025DB79B7|nr:hypothetical protein [Paraburkholderia sp.]
MNRDPNANYIQRGQQTDFQIAIPRQNEIMSFATSTISVQPVNYDFVTGKRLNPPVIDIFDSHQFLNFGYAAECRTYSRDDERVLGHSKNQTSGAFPYLHNGFISHISTRGLASPAIARIIQIDTRCADRDFLISPRAILSLRNHFGRLRDGMTK